MRIARVFPRRTKATPDDPLAFTGPPPFLDLPEIDEVHISATWTYDKPLAEELAYQWEMVGVPVIVGGPAYDDPGGEFTPGLYLKRGYTTPAADVIITAGSAWPPAGRGRCGN